VSAVEKLKRRRNAKTVARSDAAGRAVQALARFKSGAFNRSATSRYVERQLYPWGILALENRIASETRPRRPIRASSAGHSIPVSLVALRRRIPLHRGVDVVVR
jgi:hypothetical protein